MSSEAIFSSVPRHFWHTSRSTQLRHELTQYDPSLLEKPERLKLVWGALVAQNFAVNIVEDPRFLELRARKIKEMGAVIIGMLPCFDGRNVPMLQGGREVSYHPTGGALPDIDNINGLLLPRSAYLREGIRRAASNADKDLLEGAAAHAPGLEEKKEPSFEGEFGAKCGKAEALKKAGLIDADEDLSDGNLRLIKETTIPAVTNQYNISREEANLPKLEQVGLPFIFDTYRRGFILDWDQRDNYEPLSTTRLTEQYAQQIEYELGRQVGGFGSMFNEYTRLDKLLEFTQKRFEITRALLNSPKFKPFREDIIDHIRTHYPGLSERQLRGLMYLMGYTVGFQYESGLGDRNHTPINPHKDHSELMIVQSKFKNPFLLFPHVQIFASNPPESAKSVDHARLQVSIMDKEGHSEEDPVSKNITMVLASPIDGRLMGTDSETTVIADNGELVRSIYQDEVLGSRIGNDELSVYPALTDTRTREVLKVPNQRSYAKRAS